VNAFAELARARETAAAANDVFPLDEGVGLPRALRDPSLPEVGDLEILPGTPTLSHHRSSDLVHFRSSTAEIEFGWADGDQGVLVAHGDQGCGYVVYVEDGRLRLAWNEYRHLHEAAGSALRTGSSGPSCRWTSATVAATGRGRCCRTRRSFRSSMCERRRRASSDRGGASRSLAR